MELMASMTVDNVKSWFIDNGFEEYATTLHGKWSLTSEFSRAE